MNLQPIFDLAQICHQKGIKNAIISPGSRNAALTIAFARHPDIQCYSVPDERSAAFIALGMSLKDRVPTVLICTSGSAALNYAPAIAEAFFNQVPLLVLTADRPPEWIGQRDGQTIYQENVFGRHVKRSYAFPSLSSESKVEQIQHRMVQEAIDLCINEEMGPVHLNIPFREPFYPGKEDNFAYRNVRELNAHKTEDIDLKNEIGDLSDYPRLLIIAGQEVRSTAVNSLLSQLSTNHRIPAVADLISNAHEVNEVITGQDVFLKNYERDDLRPDLLITIGMSVISKNLKLYLRRHQPKAHWHVRPEPQAPDTYAVLSRHIKSKAQDFLQILIEQCSVSTAQSDFYKSWQEIEQKTKSVTQNYRSVVFSEFNCYKKVLKQLPAACDLHLANSMAVRYANVIGLTGNQNIEVFCNRGTSGIDGSNSTAVGAALRSSRPVFLLTGDMAFLYDKNAFWHNHLPQNLKIVVFNNHGGGIFRMIDGPSGQPELEEFFETRQKRDARLLAQDFGLGYKACQNETELDQALPDFVQSEEMGILEIFTDPEESKTAYKELFSNTIDLIK